MTATVQHPTDAVGKVPPSSGSGGTTRIRGRGRRTSPKPPRPPLPSNPETVETIIRILLVIAAVCAWAIAFSFGLSRVQHSASQHKLYAEFRQLLAQGVAPVGGRIAPGKPVALLEIPSIGLRGETVAEGTTSGDLRGGPGHLRSTPLPGQAGTSVLFGRSALYGAPFAHIASLEAGDAITVTDGLGTFTFNVDQVRQGGDPLPPIPAAGTAHLTLVTAAGAGWRSGWAPSTSIYVDATLSGGSVAGTPPGRTTELTPNEPAMRADTSEHVLIQVLLSVQLALLVGLAIVWLRHRTTGPTTWLIGVPVGLLTAWTVTNAAVQLLPNLF